MHGLSTLDFLVLINQAIYCGSIIPQIVVNYRLKTGKGLSDLLLFTFFGAVTACAVSFYALNMPVGYRISLTAQVVLVGILVGQRFLYDSFGHTNLLLGAYGCMILGALGALLFVPKNPGLIGNITGWVGFVLFVVNRLPQIVKVQQEKSVKGFSYGFVLLLSAAALMEMSIVLYYKLPTLVLFMASWAIICSLVFLRQFHAFSPRKR